MSVLANKRKESQFEVFNHFYKVRRSVTDLLLRDFGYSPEKADKHLQKMFGGKNYDELSEEEKIKYMRKKSKNESFEEWFILEQRKVVLDCLRGVQECIFVANSIYPQYKEELIGRRIYQDKAIGQCFRLIQELQYSIETLPVKIDIYLQLSKDIENEINLIKSWRKSDNKFKKVISVWPRILLMRTTTVMPTITTRVILMVFAPISNCNNKAFDRIQIRKEKLSFHYGKY